MKKWSDEEGTEFRNSDICYGREYKADTDKIDIAKVTIKGEFPGDGQWGYLEEAHEMAVVIRGEGVITTKKGERHNLKTGDVVYVEPMERFRWEGDMDLIMPCGPAFDPKKHKIEKGQS
jgi:mannose-6-phosphate isomerase-like protein (cupin superfamily)